MSTRSTKIGPLSRFTVLDLTRVRAGPTAVRQLADWGANVIKIEATAAIDTAKGMGGARHGPDFQNLHRNKRALTLNLKSTEGVEVFKRMAGSADVIVENYRPDVKHRLGIDYETIRTVNPRIVYASLSGFGQDGPYADRPGFDQIAQGMGGLMSITGLPGQGPVRAGIPVADLTCGLYGAIGILVALLERESSGEGQWVQTSLLQAQIAMLDFQAVRWLMNKDVAPQAGNNHPTSIPTGAFQTSDGHINIGASGQSMWERLCRLLGLESMIDDPDFADGEARSRNRDRLNQCLQDVLIGNTSAYWIEAINDVGVPCGPIYGIDQMFDDPQVRHLGMARPVEHPQLGTIEILNQAVTLSRAPEKQYTATPERGEHTDEVLAEFGFEREEIDDYHTRGVV
ncbi:MAG: CaiB/BaiF CoA transferase family protein [Gammaproteobacteria bacterium]